MEEQTVRHVARLARLALSDAEARSLAADLTTITEYLSQLSNVDVTGVEMTVHPLGERNQWREDQPAPGLSREQAVANSPASEHNFFQVPPVIE